jgi:hypothetical protein
MERELRIFEMSNATNLVSLARSQLLQERLPKGYTATQARHAANLKVVPHSDDDLRLFMMLPDTGSVSTAFLCPLLLHSHFLFVPMVPACRR